MNDNLGDLLVMAGLITDKQLDTAKSYQSSLGGELRTILVKMGFVDDKKLTEFMAMQEELQVADVESMVIPFELVKTIPREIVVKHQVLPVHASKDVITLAMVDPTNYEAIEQVQFITGKRVEVNLASREKMVQAIRQFYDTMDGEVDDPLMRDLASDPEMKSLRGPGSKPSIPKVTPKKRYELLLPALVPLLIEKGIVKESELKAMLDKLNRQG